MRTHRHVDARMVNIVIMKSIRFDSNRIRPCRFIEKLCLATYWFWYNTTLFTMFTMFTSINVSTNVILPSAHLARVANMPLDYLDEEQAEAWFSWIFNFKDLKVLKHPTYLMFNDVHQCSSFLHPNDWQIPVEPVACGWSVRKCPDFPGGAPIKILDLDSLVQYY